MDVLNAFVLLANFVLTREFFGRLTQRSLDYYLSRELSNHIGPGQRFAESQRVGQGVLKAVLLVMLNVVVTAAILALLVWWEPSS
jgi:hypothetical protein